MVASCVPLQIAFFPCVILKSRAVSLDGACAVFNLLLEYQVSLFHMLLERQIRSTNICGCHPLQLFMSFMFFWRSVILHTAVVNVAMCSLTSVVVQMVCPNDKLVQDNLVVDR